VDLRQSALEEGSLPFVAGEVERLTLLEQTFDGVRRRILADVLYVSLRGPYGVGSGAQN
jgi:hypothetical protein